MEDSTRLVSQTIPLKLVYEFFVKNVDVMKPFVNDLLLSHINHISELISVLLRVTEDVSFDSSINEYSS